MSYKVITYTIKKEEIKDNILINKKFILEKEIKSIIIGTVSNKEGKIIDGCAVVLQEYNSHEDQIIDKSIVYTNEEGHFGFSLVLKKDKNYRVIVYAPNSLI
ncbi:hypothetical protein [Terrisporobacter mayombei]|uniref:Carboxypeptidase regulatory-like domain-containing protein n=1 Tax=Terrisporobacter mayombei TaxID=1541 RepID=A0ABY9Q631_9FIRM|nr:hypothetical protein [Terrisporobacter mayombei]MCC3867754.1 hypothetical protein [Terrisporobacter mayombei]WMT82017.1 hypothetical protein TEMA_23680 [Terrisporobacter mayombei]